MYFPILYIPIDRDRDGQAAGVQLQNPVLPHALAHTGEIESLFELGSRPIYQRCTVGSSITTDIVVSPVYYSRSI